MRFIVAKEEKVCQYCGSEIQVGEEAIFNMFQRHSGWIEFQFFHTQCYLKWSSMIFMEALSKWRQERTNFRKRRKGKKPERRGRPRKYKNYVQSQRTRSLLSYYKRKGRQDKVEELEGRLKEGLL